MRATWLRDGLVRRPALPAAVLLISGIASHSLLPMCPWWWIGLGTVLGLGAWASLRQGFCCSLCLAAAIFCAGLSLAQVEACCYPAEHISQWTTEEPRLAELELYIQEPPRLLTRQPGSGRPAPPSQAVPAAVLRVKTWHGWHKATGQLVLRLSTPHPRLAMGQTVVVLGMLQRPEPALNPGQIDWANYLTPRCIVIS